MGTDLTRAVRIDVLRDLMQRILTRLGCEPEIAATVADVFVEAELRGQPVEGLEQLIYSMVRALHGRMNPNGRPRIVKDGEAFALIDGDRGPGQVAGVFAADLAIHKARKSGCCVVGIVNSRDMAMAGYYAERIARAGLVGLIFTDALPQVHPYGGMERILGANAIAIGIPTAGAHPVLLDFGTCAGMFRDIYEAARRGEDIPEGLAIGSDGLPTRNAAAAIEGALSPFGGHKGYGLGLCVGLLSGPLVGAAVGRATGRSLTASSVLPSGETRPDLWETLGKEDLGPTGSKGHLFIAIDPAVFGDPATFRVAVSAYIKEVKDSRKAPGVSEIRVPGERAFSERERSVHGGVVPIEERVWADTAKLAAVLGVTMPQE